MEGAAASALATMDESEMLELLDGGLSGSDAFMELDGVGLGPWISDCDVASVDKQAELPSLLSLGPLDARAVHDLAMVNATRAFVEECEVEERDDALGSGDDSSTTAASSSTPSDSDSSGSASPVDPHALALVAKPARRSRMRPKDELARLRRQEYELSAKLRELRLETRRQVARSSQPGRVATREHSLLFWERAVARQLQYRRLSEEENQRLKLQLQAQARQARQLQQALARRMLGAESQESATPPARQIPSDNAAVFEVLLDDIDVVYASLDAFCVATDGAPNDQRAHALAGTTRFTPSAVGDAPFVEHRRLSSVPFGLRRVQSAIWMTMRTRRNRVNPNFFRNAAQFAQDSGGVLRSSASSLVPNTEYPLYVQSQLAARVINERRRVVVVSKALMEPKGQQRGESLGVKYAEINVHILTPGADGDGDGGGDGSTTIEMRSSMSRYILPGPNAARWQREESAVVAKQMWSKVLAGRTELFEAFLLDPSEP